MNFIEKVCKYMQHSLLWCQTDVRDKKYIKDKNKKTMTILCIRNYI